MYANQQMEQISRENLAELQMRRLQKTLKWAFEKSVFYSNKLQEEGISPDNITALDDVQKLPFTLNTEIMQKPLDFLTLPLSSIMRIHMGDSSRKLIKMYTNNDIAQNVELMTRALVASGITRASVVGILGDFSDSRIMDVQYALELLGATVVPMGVAYEKAIPLMEMSGIDTLICAARYLIQFIVQMQAAGEDIADRHLLRILCLNENIQNSLRRHIERRMNTQVYDLFAPCELGCNGMLFQCSERRGQHLAEDCFYAEVVEFGNKRVIEGYSQMGELVVTTLAAEAMPLIRFRTGQAVMRLEEPCTCGRTLVRLATPVGINNT